MLTEVPYLKFFSLHQDHVAFRGQRAESAGQVLTGSVILHNLASLNEGYFRLRLLEELEVAELVVRKWNKVPRSSLTRTKISVAEHFQPLPAFEDAAIKSALDYCEFQFQIPLPGDLVESIEGLPEMRLKYRLELTICIAGAPVAKAYKRLRILRVAAPDAMEIHHAESVERVWHDKLDYCLSIPQKVVSFGGVVHLNISAAALLMGLRLERIAVKLTEDREIRTNSHSGHAIQSRFRRVLAKVTFNKPTCRLLLANELATSCPPSWTLFVSLPLPNSLEKCAQDVNIDLIQVTHAVKVLLILKNPDGHISEVSNRRGQNKPSTPHSRGTFKC